MYEVIVVLFIVWLMLKYFICLIGLVRFSICCRFLLCVCWVLWLVSLLIRVICVLWLVSLIQLVCLLCMFQCSCILCLADVDSVDLIRLVLGIFWLSRIFCGGECFVQYWEMNVVSIFLVFFLLLVCGQNGCVFRLWLLWKVSSIMQVLVFWVVQVSMFRLVVWLFMYWWVCMLCSVVMRLCRCVVCLNFSVLLVVCICVFSLCVSWLFLFFRNIDVWCIDLVQLLVVIRFMYGVLQWLIWYCRQGCEWLWNMLFLQLCSLNSLCIRLSVLCIVVMFGYGLQQWFGIVCGLWCSVMCGQFFLVSSMCGQVLLLCREMLQCGDSDLISWFFSSSVLVFECVMVMFICVICDSIDMICVDLGVLLKQLFMWLCSVCVLLMYSSVLLVVYMWYMLGVVFSWVVNVLLLKVGVEEMVIC